MEEFDVIEPTIVPQDSVHPKWTQFLTGFQAEVGWQIFRQQTQHSLLLDQAMTVPFITEARSFQLGQLVQKSPQSVAELISNSPPQYGVIGQFQQFAAYQSDEVKTSLDRVDSQVYWDRHGDYFRLYLADKVIEEGPADKSLQLTIKKIKKFRLEPFKQGQVQLDVKKLPRQTPSLYLITEVFASPLVVIDVTIANETCRFRYANFIPIGFSLKKYRLDSNGWLTPTSDLLTVLKKDVIWARPEDKKSADQQSPGQMLPAGVKVPQLHRTSPKLKFTPPDPIAPAPFNTLGKPAFFPQCRHTADTQEPKRPEHPHPQAKSTKTTTGR